MTGSQSEYGIVVSWNVMVAMRDGVRLATDVYRPALPEGSPAPARFPAILGRTSYDRSSAALWVDPVARFFVPRGGAQGIACRLGDRAVPTAYVPRYIASGFAAG